MFGNTGVTPLKTLKAGVDLNSLVYPDTYYLDKDGGYGNCPIASYATLTITTISSLTGKRLVQTLYTYNAEDMPVIYMRIVTMSGFGIYPNQGTIYAKAWNILLTHNPAKVYADNDSAKNGGLVAGQTYRTSTGQLMIVY